MSLLVLLVLVDLALCIGSAFGKIPAWAVEFAICLTLLVAYWGKG